jgi:hypothetical protein
VGRVDPDPLRDISRSAARVRFQVGDDFAAAGAARSPPSAIAFPLRSLTSSGPAGLGLSAWPASTLTASALATLVLAFAAGRSLQVGEGAFELTLVLVEGRDVVFDQALGLVVYRGSHGGEPSRHAPQLLDGGAKAPAGPVVGVRHRGGGFRTQSCHRLSVHRGAQAAVVRQGPRPVGQGTIPYVGEKTSSNSTASARTAVDSAR